MSETEEGRFQQIEVGRLRPSKTNPRGKISAAEIAELARSVESHGILQNLVVRPLDGEDGQFEIVAGERRWKAAKAAKLATVPTMVRKLTDAEVVEIQLVENLQRADVHPLDEAKGYKTLVKLGTSSVSEIAAKVGKSESYIYQAMKLAELIPYGQDAFREGRITKHHAVLIARLQPPDQERALDYCFGVWPGGMHKSDNEKIRKEGECEHGVRELARFIEHECHLDLSKAPFPVADALLVKKAGACTTCPKRTGFNKALFEDITGEDTCTDPACYAEKVSAFVQLRIQEVSKAEGPAPPRLTVRPSYERQGKLDKGMVPSEKYTIIEAKRDACEFARESILADGPHAGTLVTACSDLNCGRHFGKGGQKRYQTEPVERQAKQKQDTRLEILRETRARVFDSILERAPGKLTREELNITALVLFGNLPWHMRQAVYKRHEWKAQEHKYAKGMPPLHEYGGEPLYARIRRMKDAEFAGFLIGLSITPDATILPQDAAQPLAPPLAMSLFARRAKVQYGSIERKVRKEIAAKRKAKPPRKSKRGKMFSPTSDRDSVGPRVLKPGYKRFNRSPEAKPPRAKAKGAIKRAMKATVRVPARLRGTKLHTSAKTARKGKADAKKTKK